LEDILKTAVVFLQDGILRAQIERPFLHQRILETGMGEATNRLQISPDEYTLNPAMLVTLTSSVLYIAIPTPPVTSPSALQRDGADHNTGLHQGNQTLSESASLSHQQG
jgi:hypothetical protein